MLTINHRGNAVVHIGTKVKEWNITVLEDDKQIIYHLFLSINPNLDCLMVVDSSNNFHSFLFNNKDNDMDQLMPIYTVRYKLELKGQKGLLFGKAILGKMNCALFIENDNGCYLHQISLDEEFKNIIQYKRFTMLQKLQDIRDIAPLSSTSIAVLHKYNEFNEHTVTSKGTTIRVDTFIFQDKGNVELGPFVIHNVHHTASRLFNIFYFLVIFTDADIVLWNEDGKKTQFIIQGNNFSIKDVILVHQESTLSKAQRILKIARFVILSKLGFLYLCKVKRENRMERSRYSFSIEFEKLEQVFCTGKLHCTTNINLAEIFIVSDGGIQCKYQFHFASEKLVPIIQNKQEFCLLDRVCSNLNKDSNITYYSYFEDKIICCGSTKDVLPFIGLGQWSYDLIEDVNHKPMYIQGIPHLFHVSLTNEDIWILGYNGTTILHASNNDSLANIINCEKTMVKAVRINDRNFLFATAEDIFIIHCSSKKIFTIISQYHSIDQILFLEYCPKKLSIFFCTKKCLKKLCLRDLVIENVAIEMMLKNEPSCFYLYNNYLFLGYWTDSSITIFHTGEIEELVTIPIASIAKEMSILSEKDRYYLIVSQVNGESYTLPLLVHKKTVDFNINEVAQFSTGGILSRFASISEKMLLCYSDSVSILLLEKGVISCVAVTTFFKMTPGIVHRVFSFLQGNKIIFQIQDCDNSVVLAATLCKPKLLWKQTTMAEHRKCTPIQIHYLKKLDLLITLVHDKSKEVTDSLLITHLKDQFNQLRPLHSLKFRESVVASDVSFICRGLTSLQISNSTTIIATLIHIGTEGSQSFKCSIYFFKIRKHASYTKIDYKLEFFYVNDLGKSVHNNNSEAMINGYSIHSIEDNLIYIFNNQIYISKISTSDDRIIMSGETRIQLPDYELFKKDKFVIEQFLSRSSPIYQSMHLPLSRVFVFTGSEKKEIFQILCASLTGGMRLIQVIYERDRGYKYKEIASECIIQNQDKECMLKPMILSALIPERGIVIIHDMQDNTIKEFIIEERPNNQQLPIDTLKYMKFADEKNRFQTSDEFDYIISNRNKDIEIDDINQGELSMIAITFPTHRFKLIKSLPWKIPCILLINCSFGIPFSKNEGERSNWKKWLDILYRLNVDDM